MYYIQRHSQTGRREVETSIWLGIELLWGQSEQRIENRRHCLKYSLRSFFSNISSILGPLTLFTPRWSLVPAQQFSSLASSRLWPCLQHWLKDWYLAIKVANMSKYDNYDATTNWSCNICLFVRNSRSCYLLGRDWEECQQRNLSSQLLGSRYLSGIFCPLMSVL